MKFLIPSLLLLGICLNGFSADDKKPGEEVLKVVDAGGDQMKSLKEHFPNGLTDADGNEVKLESLKGKVIGIYFSAAWCGPCRAFSPVLFKHRDKYKDDFQVIFVSSDRTDEAQSEYMKKNKMNCPTMKRRGDAANALSQKYGVRGIPTLVLIDHQGNFLSRDGRALITKGIDMKQLTAGKTKVVKEEYLCGKCDKIHTRNKVVAEDPKEQAKFQ